MRRLARTFIVGDFVTIVRSHAGQLRQIRVQIHPEIRGRPMTTRTKTQAPTDPACCLLSQPRYFSRDSHCTCAR
jgi:hypothetical protein